MGRSVAALLVMLVAFIGLAGLFIALDSAAGVHPQTPLLAASAQATATPPPTSATATVAGSVVAPTVPSASSTAAASAATAPATGGPGAPSSSNATPTGSATTPIGSATMPTSSVATGTVTAAGTITATFVTPPYYGTSLNYPNNTTFSPAFMQALDERVIALTNAQRSAHGLTPLSESGQLDIIAAARSQDQIKRHYFDHYDPTGPIGGDGRHEAAVRELLARDGVAYTEVGENLINRVRYPLDQSTPQQLVDQWMQHPEHRDNILHGGYTMIGVGMAAENEADGLHVIATQVFVR